MELEPSVGAMLAETIRMESPQLLSSQPVPVYSAVIKSNPVVGQWNVENAVVPLTSTMPLPGVVEPSLKTTVTVGMPVPYVDEVTVAVSATDWT